MNIKEFRKEIYEIETELNNSTWKYWLDYHNEKVLYSRIKDIKPKALDILPENDIFIKEMFKSIDNNKRISRIDMKKMMNILLKRTENRKSLFFKKYLRKITGEKGYNLSLKIIDTINKFLDKIPKYPGN